MPKKSDSKRKGDKATEKKVTEEAGKSEDVLSDIKSRIPDMSNITKKIDLDGILGSIKSMINPEEGASVSADPNDALGMKITQLSALLKEISKTHAQLAKDFSKANDLLASLFKDVEAVRVKGKLK